MQLKTTFFRRQVTVSGQVSQSHARQQTLDPGGHLESISKMEASAAVDPQADL